MLAVPMQRVLKYHLLLAVCITLDSEVSTCCMVQLVVMVDA